MMKSLITLALILFFIQTNAQEKEKQNINNWLLTNSVEIKKPVFSHLPNVNSDVFDDAALIKLQYVPNMDFRPSEDDLLDWSNFEKLVWKVDNSTSDGTIFLSKGKGGYQLAFLAFYIENSGFSEVEFMFKSAQMMEVFVDGEMQKGKYSFDKKDEKGELKFSMSLETNNHVVLIKSLFKSDDENKWAIQGSYSLNNENNKLSLKQGTDAHLYMDINHLMNGVDIQEAEISAAGDYYFVSYKTRTSKNEILRLTDVRTVAENKSIQLFYNDEVSQLQWSPNGNKLSYVTTVGDKSWIWEYDINEGKKYPVNTQLAGGAYFTWSPNQEYLVVSETESPKEDKTGLKQVQHMADHWPWYRSRTNLSKIDVLSGVKTPLTHGYLSNNLQDISKNGRYILFSQSIYEETGRPFSRQILFQYDNLKQELDTIWSKKGNSSVEYSPDGNSLLVSAGPSFFGDVGIATTNSKIPNEYDQQVYLYNIENQSVISLTKSFNPSVEGAHWSEYNNDWLYLLVSDRTYHYIYKYSFSVNSFELMSLKPDVINSMDFSRKKPAMLFYGSSISEPKKLYITDLDLLETRLIEYPEEYFFKDMVFGKTEDWNFTNREGVTIEGRLYYPPNFDASKKYPLIVYYYGGTSPTERDFRGRYPKNLFAANGYLVYVLQPSGATGYGQDFSAMHVNNWGKTVAAEIIDGSKKLCRTHDFIDSTSVGCIGASYGGFMTMYLTTQTDFFCAAISHAGISSISSYWGEGYWGYLYSEVASANSFPWNNKELYIDQSPLFQADKVNTPILLLHGNKDTNVPPGESRQFLTALKLLNKEVELIEIDNQDHHIVDYDKRVLWQKTILAWFDKHLKKEPDWWNKLYPKKNL